MVDAPGGGPAPQRAPAQDAADGDRCVLLELQLIGAIPLPPFAAGLGVSLGLIAAVALLDLALGVPIRPAGGADIVDISGSFRSAALVSLLIGYTMAAGRYLNLAITRDLVQSGQLDPVLDDRRAVTIDRALLGRARLMGTAGLLVGLGIHTLASRKGGGFEPLAAPNLWSLVLTPLLFALLARALLQTSTGVSGSRTKVGGSGPAAEIDLLDLRPFYAQGRIGLRLALVWIVGSTISSLFFFDPALLPTMLPILVGGLAIAVLALLLPARRVHRLLLATKRRELERLQPLLRAARAEALGSHPAALGRLADLLAWCAYVEGLRDWPFDDRTLRRFVFYLLIPIGSWLGGALVERLLGLVLDT